MRRVSRRSSERPRTLFEIEEELGVSTLFWYRIIHWIADLADYAERVANRLRVLIAS